MRAAGHARGELSERAELSVALGARHVDEPVDAARSHQITARASWGRPGGIPDRLQGWEAEDSLASRCAPRQLRHRADQRSRTDPNAGCDPRAQEWACWTFLLDPNAPRTSRPTLGPGDRELLAVLRSSNWLQSVLRPRTVGFPDGSGSCCVQSSSYMMWSEVNLATTCSSYSIVI